MGDITQPASEVNNKRLLERVQLTGMGLCVDIGLLSLVAGVVRSYEKDVAARAPLADTVENRALILDFAGQISEISNALDEVRIRGALIPTYLTQKEPPKLQEFPSAAQGARQGD
jgi:hypothetical protein